jgi:hypothetical protein
VIDWSAEVKGDGCAGENTLGSSLSEQFNIKPAEIVDMCAGDVQQALEDPSAPRVLIFSTFVVGRSTLQTSSTRSIPKRSSTTRSQEPSECTSHSEILHVLLLGKYAIPCDGKG